MVAIQPGGKQCCTTSTIRWKLTEDSDPELKVPSEQIKLWINLWNSSEKHEQKELREAWRKALQVLVLGGFKARKVCGPLGATLAALLTAGWKATGPDHWFTEDGEQEAVIKNKPGDMAQILRAFKTT